MIKVKINDREYLVVKKNHDYYLNYDEFKVDLYQRNATEFHVLHNDLSLSIEVLNTNLPDNEVELRIKDKTFRTKIIDEKEAIIEVMKAATGNDALHQKIISPMPGLIQKIFVTEGDNISTGDPLVILNAMKMENVLKSPTNGKISRISIEEGEQVEKGKILIQF